MDPAFLILPNARTTLQAMMQCAVRLPPGKDLHAWLPKVQHAHHKTNWCQRLDTSLTSVRRNEQCTGIWQWQSSRELCGGVDAIPFVVMFDERNRPARRCLPCRLRCVVLIDVNISSYRNKSIHQTHFLSGEVAWYRSPAPLAVATTLASPPPTPVPPCPSGYVTSSGRSGRARRPPRSGRSSPRNRP